MKLRWPPLPNVRLTVHLSLAVMLAASAAAVAYGLMPAWGELLRQRTLTDAQAAQYARLSRNLALRNQVAAEFQRLAGSAVQTGTDEVALSEFLRDLEAKARLPGLNIVNIKPLAVRDEKTHKVYGAKLTLAGRLAEVLRFATEVTEGDQAVGIESFSVRGTQKVHVVECTLAICKVRLVPKGPSAAQAGGAILAGKGEAHGIP